MGRVDVRPHSTYGRDVPNTIAELVEPFAFLLGDWDGEGVGLWEAEPRFRYRERLSIRAVPERALLRLSQCTVVAGSGALSHVEESFLRLFPEALVELVVAIPAGYTEIHAGRLVGPRLELSQLALGVAPRARPVNLVERRLEMVDGSLHHQVAIAVGPGPAAPHVASILTRSA
ncbi:MAG: heme-binding beta-barrel domain-containing protein [Candidatus Dormibacteria bacterium]